MAKSPIEWEKSDIYQLINDGVEENLHLEYKACGALAKTDGKKKEISKDVSAFANSDGGVIIYGVKEFDETDKKHLPEKVEDGFDPSMISKEWLEQVITSNIQPKINGLTIKPIPTGIDNKVIYIVVIPKSSTAHQAGDKRYYKRYNFESVPMEDYEIRDVMNRGRVPIVEPVFAERYLSDFKDGKPGYELNVKLVNTGKVVIKHFRLEISLPKDLILDARGHSQEEDYYRVVPTVYGRGESCVYRKLSFINSSGQLVIFPGEELLLLPSIVAPIRNIVYSQHSPIYKFMLKWRIYADEMPYKEGEIELGQIPQIR